MKLTGATCAELVRRVERTAPAALDLDLNLAGTSIRVLTSTRELRENLAAYFKEFIHPCAKPDIVITAHETPVPETDLAFQTKEPDPGKSRIKEEWADLKDGRIVRKRLTGMHFFFGQGLNAAVGPCRENANQVINFVNNRFIERTLNHGGLLGHAAGVALGGRGLSLAGISGAGKSTLALHLMSRGTDFVSNDRVIIQPSPPGSAPDSDTGVTMYGVAKQPRINPGTALNNPDLVSILSPEDHKRFLAMDTAELWQVEHKYDALIHECYGPGRFKLVTPMDGLVILNWRFGGGETRAAKVDPRERTDLLPAFMKSTGLFYLPDDPVKALGPAKAQDPGVEEYAELLSRADLIEFSGGVDFDLAAEACLAFLRDGTLP